jgi:hypothetical protein
VRHPIALAPEEEDDEDVFDDDTEDDGVPGQQRNPAAEVAPDVWLARGDRWSLAFGPRGYELRADAGQVRHAPWPMNHNQARAWARMTLSTPKEDT